MKRKREKPKHENFKKRKTSSNKTSQPGFTKVKKKSDNIPSFFKSQMKKLKTKKKKIMSDVKKLEKEKIQTTASKSSKISEKPQKDNNNNSFFLDERNPEVWGFFVDYVILSGSKKFPARVSLCKEEGEEEINILVLPEGGVDKIINYRTNETGLSKENFVDKKKVMSLENCLEFVKSFLEERKCKIVLTGINLGKQMRLLKFKKEKYFVVRDVGVFELTMKKFKNPSRIEDVNVLHQRIFKSKKKNVSTIEKSRSCRKIYLKHKKSFDRYHKRVNVLKK